MLNRLNIVKSLNRLGVRWASSEVVCIYHTVLMFSTFVYLSKYWLNLISSIETSHVILVDKILVI